MVRSHLSFVVISIHICILLDRLILMSTKSDPPVLVLHNEEHAALNVHPTPALHFIPPVHMSLQSSWSL